jgi:hypothetical protein
MILSSIIYSALLDALHFYKSASAPIGQKFVHLPQSMHLLSSIVGALNPVCVKAPTGQTRIDGQG